MYYVFLNALKGEEMYTLREAKEQFNTKTTGGHEVEILTVKGAAIFAIVYVDHWEQVTYDQNGEAVTHGVLSGVDLVPKKKKHLPKDVLCEVWDREPHLKLGVAYANGEGMFFSNGSDSCTSDGSAVNWKNFKVIENPIRPWFGGECPIPEGCDYRVRVGKHWGHEDGYVWEHGDIDNENITAYQILGELQ